MVGARKALPPATGIQELRPTHGGEQKEGTGKSLPLTASTYSQLHAHNLPGHLALL